MPTILSDKAFQAHFRELGKQLKENPDALTTDEVIADIKQQMKMPATNTSTLLGWDWREGKGEEIFTQFTSLFLETHKVSAVQAQEIRSIFENAENQWYLYGLKKNLNTQLAVNEQLKEELTDPGLKVMGTLLNQRIESIQNETKTVMKSKEKFAKFELISKVISIGMATVGLGAMASGLVMAMAAVSIPLVIITTTVGASLALLSAIPLGFQLFFGARKDRKESMIDRNTQEIQKMMNFYNKMKDGEASSFLDKLRASDSAILTKEENLKPIVDLYEYEEKARELREKIKEVENAFATRLDISEVEQLKELRPQREALQKYLTLVQTLRDKLG